MPAKRQPKNFQHVWIVVGTKRIKGWFLNDEFFDCHGKKHNPESWTKREPVL